MEHAHYPLQALFYVVALHRYLRWRLADYDPAIHLAGALYLFVRGMIGPAHARRSTAHRCGVFVWRPPAALVVATSELLDRGARMTGPDALDAGSTRTTPGWRAPQAVCCATFNVAGVLDAADVHVARRLGCLVGETDEAVLLGGRARRPRPAPGSRLRGPRRRCAGRRRPTWTRRPTWAACRGPT